MCMGVVKSVCVKLVAAEWCKIGKTGKGQDIILSACNKKTNTIKTLLSNK